MTVTNTHDDSIQVAAVCDTEVRIYAKLLPHATSRRFLRKITFPNQGAAKLYADEYEQTQRRAKVPRPSWNGQP